MTFINPTAAYVRVKDAPMDTPALDGHEDVGSIWRLLATPQTVKTLQRQVDSRSNAGVEESAITAVLEELLSRDLIEMSPDT